MTSEIATMTVKHLETASFKMELSTPLVSGKTN